MNILKKQKVKNSSKKKKNIKKKDKIKNIVQG